MGVAKSIQNLTRKMCVFNAPMGSNAANCDCGHPCQTMAHIIDDCPIHAFEDELLSLHEAPPEAIQYLSDLNINL
jgi:hypothetical protein